MTDILTGTDAVNAASAIDAYLDAFGEPDSDARRRLIAAAFASGAALIDPPLTGTGHDGLDEMFVIAQSHYPGHTFRRTSGIDAHHGSARYEWELVATDGQVAVAGTDVARLDSHGRLVEVVGFFGPLPEIGS